MEEHDVIKKNENKLYDVTFHAFLPAEGDNVQTNLDRLYKTMSEYIKLADYSGAGEISADNDAVYDGKWYADLWLVRCVRAVNERSAREKAQAMLKDIFTDKAYLPDIAEINEYGGN